jgi:hypothetical protein
MKNVRIEFGTYGAASSVPAKKGARVIRNLTSLQTTVGDLKPGDLAVMSPNDEPNYETLIAAGGIAILIPVTAVSAARLVRNKR